MMDGLLHSFCPGDIQIQGVFIPPAKLRLVDCTVKYSEKKTLYFIWGHAHLTQAIIFLKPN